MNIKKKFENTHFIALCIVLMFILSLIQNIYFSLNPDTSWLIIVAEKLLEGKILGKDIIEVNPPASAIIYIPGILISKLVHLRPEIGVSLTVYILTFLLCLFIININNKTHISDKLAINILCLFFVSITCLYFQYYFSQREHFALILSIPYIMTSCIRINGQEQYLNRWFFIVSGICMGLSGCIKPVFFLAPFLCNLSFIFTKRDYRGLFWVENFITLIVLIFYGFVVFIFFKEYIQFLNEFVFEAYLARQQTWEWVFFSEGFLYITLVVLYGMLTLFFGQSPLQKQFSLASIGYYLAFVMQRKGYFYHVYPAFVSIYLSFVLLCFRIIRKKMNENYGFMIKLPVFVVIIYGVVLTATSVFTNWHVTKRSRQAEAYINEIAPHPTMASLAASFGTSFPLVLNVQGRWVVSLHSIITITHLLPEEQRQLLDGDYDAAFLTPKDKWLIEKASQDIIDNKPDIIVLETLPEWTAFLLSFPKVRNALSMYTHTKSLDRIDIWVRNDLLLKRK